MAKRGKRYQEIAKLVDRQKFYSPAEAIALVKKCATAKFDETVEVAFKLGVDPAMPISRCAAPLFCRTEQVVK